MQSSSAPAIRRCVQAAGRTISYLEAGPADGPAVVLLHGLASDCTTWDRAIGPLADGELRVVAVDLIGHGESDKPAGDYLLSDFTESLAAFFAAAGIERATVCGHSLGGAIAVTFAYHHPELVNGLVLVSAGGLGREVHPVLRAAAVRGSERVLEVAARPSMQRLYRWPRLHKWLRLTPDNLVNLQRAGRSLGTAEGRAAFLASLRGVIEPAGQRGSFIEMQYLAEHMPTLLVWAEGDGVIPVSHARAAHAHLPGSRLVVFPGSGHEPHRRNAAEFAAAVVSFVRDSVSH